jgi:hypothetical protein
MATISVGENKGGRRAVVHDLPLVPFIDFMVCLIAFLMVTAAWTQMSRISASGQAPGQLGPTSEPRKVLHVLAAEHDFELRWQRGQTTLESRRVPRAAVPVGSEPRYPALERSITEEWQSAGEHRAESDRQLDRAVLHVSNDLPFSEIVAVLDALQAPRRGTASAFDVAFASD